MNLRPGKNKVIIKRHEAKAETDGGFIMPEGSRERPDIGFVVAVGSVVEDWVEGDRVLFPKHSGFDVKASNGQDYVVMLEDEVWLCDGHASEDEKIALGIKTEHRTELTSSSSNTFTSWPHNNVMDNH